MKSTRCVHAKAGAPGLRAPAAQPKGTTHAGPSAAQGEQAAHHPMHVACILEGATACPSLTRRHGVSSPLSSLHAVCQRAPGPGANRVTTQLEELYPAQLVAPQVLQQNAAVNQGGQETEVRRAPPAAAAGPARPPHRLLRLLPSSSPPAPPLPCSRPALPPLQPSPLYFSL